LSRLDRGTQYTATGMLPLARVQGVGHSFNCTPRLSVLCVLLTRCDVVYLFIHTFIIICRARYVEDVESEAVARSSVIDEVVSL